jgi:hypothetical protein
MSDAAPAPAAPAPTATDVLAAQMSPEQARETIKGLIHDKDFYAKLKAEDPRARQYWGDLHKAGFPAPDGDTASVLAQATRREAQMRESALGTYASLAGFDARQINEIRTRQPVTPEEHDWGVRTKARILADPVMRGKIMAKDMDATNLWFRAVQIASLPVKPA